jgi:hypothetical protein
MGYLTLGIAHSGRVVREREFTLSGNYRLTPVGLMRIATEAGPGGETPEVTVSATSR